MTSSADIIAARLYRAGIRHAFGVPGGEVVAIIDALERAGIRFVLARHENAAGFMAEGAWHATGAPGLLVATVGPGVANTVNVMANAAQDRVPLILISGRVPEGEALRYTHQVFDHQAVLRPVVKASFEARAGACDTMIDKALRLALEQRPGPVHIDLPIDVATAEHGPARPDTLLHGSAAAPAAGPALDAARAAFRAAERPVIVAGLDLLTAPGAVATLRDTARRFGIPVVTSYKAKGVLPEDDPLSLGGHGLSPKSDRVILPLLARADLVIALGYDPIEMRTGWQDPWDPAACIEFAAAPNRHDMHAAGLSWTCDPGAGLAALVAGAEPKPLWPGGEPGAARAALARAFAPPPGHGPGALFQALDLAVPGEVVITVDSGAHRILLSQMRTCTVPATLLQSTGLCTMGCALPLAIGRKLADPAARVLAVMGDGCLDMVLGELLTLRDLALPVPVLVLVDGSLALIELKQRRDGRQAAGVDFGVTDYAALARTLGFAAYDVADAAELPEALAAAFAAPGPSLIAAAIPRRAYDGLF